jgi:hypothetical protein
MYFRSFIFLLFYLSTVNLVQAQLRVLVLQMQVDQPQDEGLVKKAMYLTTLISSKVVELPKEKYMAITKENLMMLLPPDQTLEACIGECEVNIGRIVGAQRVISSLLFQFENGKIARLNLNLINTENGAIINSLNLKADSIIALEEKINLHLLSLFEDQKQASALNQSLRESIAIPIVNQGLEMISEDDLHLIALFEQCQKGKVDNLMTLKYCEQFVGKVKDPKYSTQKEQASEKIQSCQAYWQDQKEKQQEVLENQLKLKAFEKKRDQDWSKLSKLLKLSSVPDQQKEQAVMRFFEIYGTHPSLNPYLYFDEPYVKRVVDLLLK